MLAGLVTHCVISNNVVHGGWGSYNDPYAAGVRISGGRLENCLVVGNRTAGFDDPAQNRIFVGGVHVSGSGSVVNCTIAGNNRSNVYGGVHTSGAGSVINCVIAGNNVTNTTITALDNPNAAWGGNASLFSHCVLDTAAPINGDCFAASAEMLFKNPAEANFRLRSGSPAINNGTEVSTSATDLDGNPRVFGKSIDIGCYELQHAAGTLLMVR